MSNSAKRESDTTPASEVAARQRIEPAILALAMVLPSVTTYVYFVALQDQPSNVQQIVGGVLKIVQFALPLVWVTLTLRQPLCSIRPTTKGLIAALLFGAAVAVALIIYRRPLLEALGVLDVAQDAVHEKVSELGFVSRGKYLGLAVFYTLAHSLLEEYYWRWFVFGRLRKYVGETMANLVSSLAFTAHHVIVLSQFFGIAALATWLCSAGVGVGGAVWARIYHRCGHLFPVWMSHALVDAAIFYIGFQFLFS